MSWVQTAERVTDDIVADNYVYQRCLAAYTLSAPMIHGDVFEIGTGSGYGVQLVAPNADKFVTLDKFRCDMDVTDIGDNVEFIQMTIPPIVGIADNSYDFVISFQVIEHIQDHLKYVQEIHRILKPGGAFIVTTPNRLTTLSRNPWHIREYSPSELQSFLAAQFNTVKTLGVFGSDRVMTYYQENKKSVANLTKWDIFDLQWRLPRQALQIPFDIMNRLNRRRLMNDNNTLVASLNQSDFSLKEVNDDCLDLFYVAVK